MEEEKPMSQEQQVPGADEQPPRGDEDYEYDEAHDAGGSARDAVPPSPRRAPLVEVATETDDDLGDLSYDLAHEVPRHHPS